jgi:hypothetical protein
VLCVGRAAAAAHLDCGVVADEVDAVVGAVDHVEHALRHAGLIKGITRLRLRLRLRLRHCG